MENNNFTKNFISAININKKIEEAYIKRLRNFLNKVNSELNLTALDGINRLGSDLKSASVSTNANYRLYLYNGDVYIRFELPSMVDYHMACFDSGEMVRTEKSDKTGTVVMSAANFKNILDSLGFTYLIDQSGETLTNFKKGQVKDLTGMMIIAKDYPELVRELYAPELRQKLAIYKSLSKKSR